MTAPALYRYYASRDDLVTHVIAGLYDEVSGALEEARDRVTGDNPLGRLLAVARRFRTWALEHPREFGLLFGSPIPGADRPSRGEAGGSGAAHPAGATDRAGERFAGVFAALFVELYHRQPFAVPSDDEIPRGLRRQLARWRAAFPGPLPLGALQVFLTGWMRLYGSVCMEVFGHLRFALEDAEPMFEHELASVTDLLTAP